MPKHWRDGLTTEPPETPRVAVSLTEIEMLLIRQQIGPGAIFHGLNLGYQLDCTLGRALHELRSDEAMAHAIPALHALAQADQDAARPARLVRPDLMPPPDHGDLPAPDLAR